MIVNEISLEIQNIISLTKICLYDVDNFFMGFTNISMSITFKKSMSSILFTIGLVCYRISCLEIYKMKE